MPVPEYFWPFSSASWIAFPFIEICLSWFKVMVQRMVAWLLLSMTAAPSSPTTAAPDLFWMDESASSQMVRVFLLSSSSESLSAVISTALSCWLSFPFSLILEASTLAVYSIYAVFPLPSSAKVAVNPDSLLLSTVRLREGSFAILMEAVSSFRPSPWKVSLILIFLLVPVEDTVTV